MEIWTRLHFPCVSVSWDSTGISGINVMLPTTALSFFVSTVLLSLSSIPSLLSACLQSSHDQHYGSFVEGLMLLLCHQERCDFFYRVIVSKSLLTTFLSGVSFKCVDFPLAPISGRLERHLLDFYTLDLSGSHWPRTNDKNNMRWFFERLKENTRKKWSINWSFSICSKFPKLACSTSNLLEGTICLRKA